jgi:hypothetical protein
LIGLEVLFGIGVFVWWVWRQWQRSEELLKKYGAQVHFTVGKYLVGLENCNYVTSDVQCVVAPNDFVFAKMDGMELGRVPRDSIEEIAFDDKSQIAQRLTATRMVALGVFALATPKRKKYKEWCVAIRWVDSKGLRRSTVFEFSGSNPEEDANTASNKLLKFTRQRSQTAEPSMPVANGNADSKKCPYCAETIKAAANCLPILQPRAVRRIGCDIRQADVGGGAALIFSRFWNGRSYGCP